MARWVRGCWRSLRDARFARSWHRDPFETAAARTRARYETAPRGDRFYVAGKLALDPVCRLAVERGGSLGRVLDLGCGRGQLALLLLDSGLAASASGFDSDARKIEVARAAGPRQASESPIWRRRRCPKPTRCC